jgi:hypothetical protein
LKESILCPNSNQTTVQGRGYSGIKDRMVIRFSEGENFAPRGNSLESHILGELIQTIQREVSQTVYPGIDSFDASPDTPPVPDDPPRYSNTIPPRAFLEERPKRSPQTSVD